MVTFVKRLAMVVALVVAALTVPSSAQAVVPRDNGFYEIRSRANNLCLDVYGFSTADGGAVVQWPCNGAANQQWRPLFVKFCSPFISITQMPCYVWMNKHSGKCLDVQWGNAASRTKIWQWRCDGNNAQLWMPRYRNADRAEYQLLSMLSDGQKKGFKCLDVPYVSRDPGVQQWIFDCNSTVAQTYYLPVFKR
ncbi:RICIN domain-containing protein [Actinoplanes sp. NPDC048796]|uniref:RICIN domain-containing protein n=1 Tax=unclassified Actinoplanes TaxID=2626549 RepID=UPI00340FF349